MLILSRKPGESIVIDGRIVVKIMRLEGDSVKLGIEAPAEVPVHRHEVYAEIQKNNQEAVTDTRAPLPRLASAAVPVQESNGSPAFAVPSDFSPASASRTIRPATRN